MAGTNGASDLNQKGAPETKGKDYTCKDCKIKFSDVYEYTNHLESKDHVKGVMKNKYGEKYLEAKAKLDMKSTDETLKSNEKEAKPTESSDGSSSSDEDEDVYPCEVCKKVCTGYISYKLHLEGKKHKKALRKIKILAEMEKQNILPDPAVEPKTESLLDKVFTKNQFASNDMICHLCNKSCTGPEVYMQHCKSKSHMKKVMMTDVVKEIDSLGLSPSSTPKQIDESDNFQCVVCEKGFSGPIPYMQHLRSTVHLKQIVHVAERHKIEDLIVGSEEDSKFHCKECGKMFSGPIPFSAHLKSSVHGKLKKKSAILENLETQHPEMFKGSTVHDSDDEDSDSDVLLGCEVCHKAFSGPETARDHFSSLKHKKALKKKAQFQKYKKQVKQQKLLETVPEVKQKSATTVLENTVDSDKCDSDEFDIISNP